MTPTERILSQIKEAQKLRADDKDFQFQVASRTGWHQTLRQLEEAVKALERVITTTDYRQCAHSIEVGEALSRIAEIAGEK